MDIAGLSTALSMSRLSTEVGTALLDKTMETTEELGAAMVKMMERSVNPHIGGNIDISV